MTDRTLSRRRFLGVVASAAAVGASGAVESSARRRDDGSMYTALPCEQVLSIGSGRSPFFSRPEALLRALAKIARA